MTVLDALAILEAATVQCKQRDIYTPVLREALNFLQPRIRPEWLVPQFRYHAQLNEDKNEVALDKEAQQQALRAIFPRIRESVKGLLGKQRHGYTYQDPPFLVTLSCLKNDIFVSPRLSNRLCPYALNRGNAFVIGCVFLGQASARYRG